MLHEFIISDARNIIIISFLLYPRGDYPSFSYVVAACYWIFRFQNVTTFLKRFEVWRYRIWLQNFFEFQHKRKIWIATFQVHVQRFKDMRLHQRYNTNLQTLMIRRCWHHVDCHYNLLLDYLNRFLQITS